MSDAHNEHQSAIKTPKQLIAAVVAGFLVPIICIVLLVQYVSNADKVGAGSAAQTPEAIAARLQPVADEGYTLKDASAPKQLQSGEAVFKAVCAACHATGAAGAPKVGDAGAWSGRIAQGESTLIEHAVKGIRAMPAKGGNPDLADAEVARAVVYMANQSGGKLKEPEVKAAPAAGAAAPAAADAGKKLYDSTCVACHGGGVAGAPKFGDKAAWAPRLKQGSATLYEHAIKGFQGKAGMMPPKGGSTAPDDEVKAAVDYMAAAAK
ncbi:cytochrome c5 family protein [Noviherbaspirillum sp. UKPF54]|uniref:c-type cytochrome n=1 Tax=Noviherbaspirillum sp. UKPF54 TaxID=2601898 RepID=UPI0011B16F00|nr:c-type cytochrome [Noviherbaspirillum sp. UKPF54]QDZ29891.1 cytochrome c5 family protein [Noviherbaspirillum sp. UKPF54]